MITIIFVSSFLFFSMKLSKTTVVEIDYHWIFGMNIFDSLTHSMTTIATGGFSNYNESIGYFDSSLIELTSIIFIILLDNITWSILAY